MYGSPSHRRVSVFLPPRRPSLFSPLPPPQDCQLLVLGGGGGGRSKYKAVEGVSVVFPEVRH